MKRLKIGLLARIIIAITLGIGFGNVLPGELVRVFMTDLRMEKYHVPR